MFIGILVMLLFTVVSVIGAAVCYKRLGVHEIFRYGLWFFILRIAVTVIDIFRNFIITPMLVRNGLIKDFIIILQGINYIPTIISLTGFIILIVGFYKSFSSSDTE
ncbi:MAG: hypothetical protein ACOZCL_17525 [Bacillota bacterium]